MSNNKQINTRIQHKHDIESNWIKALNFIPKAGEIIIYDPDDNYDYARIKIGDGSTLVNELKFSEIQPDWNINDENSPAYIKNRPFYETEPIENYVIKNETVEVTENNSYVEFTTFSEETASLIANKNYIIKINDTEYSSTAIYNTWGDLCLGNYFMSDEGLEDTGDPFCISQYYGSCSIKFTSSGTYNISIYSIEPAIVTIPHKFLNLNIHNGEGYQSIVEGNRASAEGKYSHAEGWSAIASGDYSHAEGGNTKASGFETHAEGHWTLASGDYSHAEGNGAEATGGASHAEGSVAIASGQASHAEGGYTIASNYYSHAEGSHTTASGESSHAEGSYTIARGEDQHVQGKYNIEDNNSTYAHIVGNGTSSSSPSNAHTLDWNGSAWFAGDVYVGSTSGTNKDNGSVKLQKEIKGIQGQVIGFDENGNAVAQDSLSGVGSLGNGFNAEIFNDYDYNFAEGDYSHAEGSNSMALGWAAHAEGYMTSALGDSSHVEGGGSIQYGVITGTADSVEYTINPIDEEIFLEPNQVIFIRNDETWISIIDQVNENSVILSHSLHPNRDLINEPVCILSGAGVGWGAHAEGDCTVAIGDSSHAEGGYTIATGLYSHVEGFFNIKDSDEKYVHIVGNGDVFAGPSNAHTLDWSGNAWFAGDVYVGSTSGTNKDEGSKKLVTVDEMNTAITTTIEAALANINNAEEVSF